MAIHREKVIRSAEKLVAKGKIEAAIKQYRKVLAENPNDANTLNRVGDLYARIEHFDEAVKLFSQIAEQYSRDGFFVKAIAIYKKIIKLSPQSLQVYERLAELYHKQGLLNEARTQYQILGDHYEKSDNATSAINIYQRMAVIDPDNPSHYLKLAQLYQRQQLNDKAIRSYKQLADLFLVNGSIDEATQVYLSALDAYGSELDFVRDVIRDLHDEGHVEAAQKILEKAITLEPEAEAIGQAIFGAPEPEASEPESIEPQPTAVDSPFGELPLDELPLDELPLEELPFTPSDPAPTTPSETATPMDLPGFEQGDDEGPVFTLDLDNDEPLATQVMPPPDMLDEAAESTDIDIEEDPFAETTGGHELVGGEAPEEIDWEIDETLDETSPEIEIELQEDELDIDIEVELEEELEEEDEIGVELQDSEVPISEVPISEVPISEVPISEVTGGLSAPPEAEEPTTLARHEDDLLAEAKVFSKYGLREKAEDRLKELLDIQPEHLGGLSLLAQIDLAAGRHEEALKRAKEVARIARTGADPTPWNELRDDLGKAGYTLEEDQVTPESENRTGETDRFAQLLEDLDETATGLNVIPETEAVDVVALEPEFTTSETPAAAVDGVPTTDIVAFDVDDNPPEEEAFESLDLEPITESDVGVPGVEKDALELDVLEPLEPEPLEPEPLEPEPLEPEPLKPVAQKTAPLDQDALQAALNAGMGDETAAFDQSFFEVEKEIFDEEPVEADIPLETLEGPVLEETAPEETAPEEAAPEKTAPEKTAPTNEEPFAEIEALMRSVNQAAGFEEFIPEETSLEEFIPLEDSPTETNQLEAVSPKASETAASQAKVSLVDELGLEDLDEFKDSAVSEPDPTTPETDIFGPENESSAPSSPELDETGMSWLDDVTPTAPNPTSKESNESIFDEEDDFFDLAAELEVEMNEGNDQIELETAQEQSLEEIIDGFKRGVAENLSTEDFDTHYNLGIAYREMGLLDEAIGEFQLASKDPRYIVDCSSMLGICFSEKGLPELAVNWYKKGLESPTLQEQQALGLLYDLATVYLSQGSADSAYRTFVEIYGINSNYRDVAQRIQDLQKTITS